MEEKIQFSTVSLLKINTCPYKRLDPTHYLPIHQTWECKHQTKHQTKQAIINAWLKNKINTKQFLLAYQTHNINKKTPKKEEEEGDSS
ncbi:MAG: hypothetical protein FWF66_01380 [Candidatus Bathyarchaeota archaeon]|nr:hypothetical protein [Candidatus Termiticorpusculum sp.]